uniref:Fe2OG dioxygenase domain-containing protein n=1 Tax=Lotharella oceanica TaxID=641309 RepID=A0A7S2X9L4_9EUKA
MEEVAFMKDYQNRTGLPWLSFYPRSPPILHMWDADYIGQEHLVESPEDGHPMQLKLKVISLRPRVFYVGEIITEQEVQHIMQLSKLKVKRSAVGNAGEGFLTDTRTSRTAWLRRDVSPEMDRIFSRFAKVLNIPDERLTHHRNAENLQVVTYGPGQKYSPHHDFNDKGSPPQRFLTLFIYLKPADTEGGTGFPLAFGRKGMKVQPRAGSAVLWYNMLPDGNADEMSLHEGMPVGSGEKWGCNLWVWDPVVNF